MGEIYIDGVDISKLDLDDLRKKITIIPQVSFLFDRPKEFFKMSLFKNKKSLLFLEKLKIFYGSKFFLSLLYK